MECSTARCERRAVSIAAWKALSVLLSIIWSCPARADLSLSFDQSNYSVLAPGQTSLVSIYLTQVPGGVQIGPGNTLRTAAVNLTFNSPGGIAAVLAPTDITASSAFDSSSANVSAISARLGETSIVGISDLSSPLLLGTFKLTGVSAGNTLIQVASLGPGPSFGTSQGSFVDPQNMPTVTVTVVPEPPTVVLAILAATIGGLWSWWPCLIARRLYASHYTRYHGFAPIGESTDESVCPFTGSRRKEAERQLIVLGRC